MIRVEGTHHSAPYPLEPHIDPLEIMTRCPFWSNHLVGKLVADEQTGPLLAPLHLTCQKRIVDDVSKHEPPTQGLAHENHSADIAL